MAAVARKIGVAGFLLSVGLACTQLFGDGRKNTLAPLPTKPPTTAAMLQPTPAPVAAMACTAGQYQCSGALLQTCADDLQSWVTVQRCAGSALCQVSPPLCLAAACGADEMTCAGAVLQKCNAERTGWDVFASCLSPAHCNADLRQCLIEPCNPGDRRCDRSDLDQSPVLETCRDDRQDWAPLDSCVTRELCDETLNPTLGGGLVGVELLGEGAHQIEGVIAALSDGGAGSRGEGFVIESDRNRLTGNSAVQNSAEGFRIVEGNRNQLIDNNAFFNEIGFQILIGQRNVLEGNRAGDNDVFGFHLDGGPFVPGGGRNSLKENTATGNSTGFSLDSELATRLTSNVASENERDGIEVFFGDRNRLTGNRVEDNGESGIVIASSRNAVIRLNTSLNNDRAADDVRSFDMLDSLSDCGTSRWLGNVFVTSNESCIR